MVSSKDLPWVFGAFCNSKSKKKSADGRASASGPELDFPVAHHCMVQVDYDAIYIIGGKQNGNMTNKVWIVDPTNSWSVTEGPSLLNDRQVTEFRAKPSFHQRNFILKPSAICMH